VRFKIQQPSLSGQLSSTISMLKETTGIAQVVQRQ